MSFEWDESCFRVSGSSTHYIHGWNSRPDYEFNDQIGEIWNEGEWDTFHSTQGRNLEWYLWLCRNSNRNFKLHVSDFLSLFSYDGMRNNKISQKGFLCGTAYEFTGTKVTVFVKEKEAINCTFCGSFVERGKCNSCGAPAVVGESYNE